MRSLVTAEILLSGSFGPDDSERLSDLPEALREAAQRVQRRASRLGPGAPIKLVVPADVWGLAEYGVETANEMLFEHATNDDALNWAVHKSEPMATSTATIDPDSATVAEVVGHLEGIAELIEQTEA